ncbi:MAG: cytochrome c4 [Gammaproteobacteria bacterium]|nr:cytochrome c4 [Gammaproteobacteria bacterium]
MTHRVLYKLLFLLVFVNCAYGAGDPERGKQKAVVCIGCHGADGNSSIAVYPKLAGQLEDYIFKQTLDFKEGKRKDAVMSGIVSVIPEEDDLRDVAAFFASQSVMQGIPQDSDIVRKGGEIFIRERCHFCHGEKGKNHSVIAAPPPIIGGQHKEYLFKSLMDIHDGYREADLYGLMIKALGRMSTEEMLAVCEYLSAQ